METVLNEINNIEYDVFKTLYLIKTDEDLFLVYSSFIDKDINDLIQDIKKDLLDDSTNGILYEIFESIILVEDKYLNIYNKITHDFDIVIEKPKKVEDTKTKNNFKLPRRYGKDKIIKDIKKEDRKATQAEKTMIAINTIKNIYCALERKIINDIFTERGDYDGTKILNDEEYRDIIALQELMSNKLKKILIKK
jgi:hypothetical protein